MVGGGSIAFNLKIDIPVNYFKILKELMNANENIKMKPNDLDFLLSYLFITGYLTEGRNGRYKIPSQEIKCAFGYTLIEYYRSEYDLIDFAPSSFTDILQTLFVEDQLVSYE